MDFLADFLQSLKRLELLTVSRKPEEHIPFSDGEDICPKLRDATKELSAPVTSQVPSFNRNQLLATWEAHKREPNTIPLRPRDFRHCCWEPEIAGDPEFQAILKTGQYTITASALRGMLYCYHQQFGRLSRNLELGSLLRRLIADKATTIGSFEVWNKQLDKIMGPEAPKLLAREASESWSLPEDKLKELGLNQTTEYARRFASELAILAAEAFESIDIGQVQQILDGIVSSKLVEGDHYKSALSTIIRSKRAERELTIQRQLLDFLLKNQGLGDPRITPENWAGISEVAKATVIQWLSKEDINLFFGLIMKDKEDKHGRKNFWLDYVDKIIRSRAFISRDDLQTHAVRLEEIRAQGRSFGKFIGSSPASAFILEFKNIVVVEFSEVGNACYIYQKNDFSEMVSNFWAEEIPFKSLKDRDRGEKITHSSKSWQPHTRLRLRHYGVRYG